MPKLSAAAIADRVPAVAALEQVEPLLACWRYHGGRPTRMAPIATLAGVVRGRLARRSAPSAPATGQVVAFAGAATPAHLGSLVPVLAELERRGAPAFLVTTANSAAARAAASHAGHATAAELLSDLPLRRRLRTLGRGLALARRLAAALSPAGCGDALRWIEQGLAVKESVRGWIGPVRGVLMDGDHHALRAGFILGAQAAGRQVFSLQHGFLSPAQLPIFSDRFLCWGGRFVAEAEALGVRREALVAAGCPRWDRLWSRRQAPRDGALRRTMSRSGHGPLVMVISNSHGARGNPEPYAAFRRGLAAVLASGLDVALRLHPLERGVDYYAETIAPELLGRAVVLDRSVDFVEHLRHADVIYHVYSAGAMEAMLVGVPVLFARAPGGRQICDLPEAGAGAWCAAEEAAHLCRKLGREGGPRARVCASQDDFLRRSFAHLGSATEFIVEQMLGGESRR